MIEQKCDACGNTTLVEKDGKWACESCGNIQEIQVQEKSEAEKMLDEVFELLIKKDWEKADKLCDKILKSDKNCTAAYLGKLLSELNCSKQEDLRKLRYPLDESKNYKAIQNSNDTELKNSLEKINATIIEINSSFGFTGASPTTAKRSTKVFSVISGILFMLCSIALLFASIRYMSWGSPIYFIPNILVGISTFILSIFIFKKKRTAITVLLAIISAIKLLGVLSASYLDLAGIFVVISFVLLTLVNAFQNKILKRKWAQFLVFILPFAYAFFDAMGGMSIFDMAGIALCLMAMFFFLLQLVSYNKIKKIKKER